MDNFVWCVDKFLGGEESLEGRVLREGVGVQGEYVDLACERAPGQLTGGVVTEVQLCGQDEEVNWQPGPVQCIQLVKVLGF